MINQRRYTTDRLSRIFAPKSHFKKNENYKQQFYYSTKVFSYQRNKSIITVIKSTSWKIACFR